MQSKILSRRDLEFVLYELLEVGTLTGRSRYADHSRETFDAALDTCERMATELFEPHYKKSDQNEPHVVHDKNGGEQVHIIPEVKQALDAFCQAGLMAAGQDYDLGGMQLPAVVNAACFAWFKGANVATAGYPFLTIGNANLLLAHGSKQQIDTYVRPMMEGRFFGTMCLSEPQAGSSLADIKTRAEPQPDGNYRLFGNKMWISAGEHDLSQNIVHLVLAKIPDGPPGVKGISLFIVPKKLVNADGTLGERNDVALAGLNHKMGYRGITNTLLNFGEGKFKPGRRGGMRRQRIRHRRSCPSSSTAMCVACCWRRNPTSRAAWRYACTARAWWTSRKPARARPRAAKPACCWTYSRRSPRAGPRNGAWRRTTSPSRCMEATATRATIRWSSSTATTASIRSTKARTASRRWTCSGARSAWNKAARSSCWSPGWERPQQRRRQASPRCCTSSAKR